MCPFSSGWPGLVFARPSGPAVAILGVIFSAYYGLILVNLIVNRPGRRFRFERRAMAAATVGSWLCFLAAVGRHLPVARGGERVALRHRGLPAFLLIFAGIALLAVSQYSRGFDPLRRGPRLRI